jgi:hypothetical protein
MNVSCVICHEGASRHLFQCIVFILCRIYVCYLWENALNFGLDAPLDSGKEYGTKTGTLIMRQLTEIVSLPVEFSTSLP